MVLCLLSPACSRASDNPVVDFVPDGDTVVLNDGRTVRYQGIDAPETAHEGRPAQPFAREALELNRELVLHGEVVLEIGSDEKDRYGRTLALVYLPDGTFVNGEMVRRGLSWCLYFEEAGRANHRLLELQRDAMSAGRGVWRNLKGDGRLYVGNRNSRRFHTPDCPSARRMSKRNAVPFQGLREAFWAGHSPGGRCLDNWQGE
ncbi:MAG: thermonuclease family protein [Desulfatibacillaceae bacterium]